MVLNNFGVSRSSGAYASVPWTRGLERSSSFKCHGTESFVSEEAMQASISHSKQYHISRLNQAKMVNFDRHQKIIELPTKRFPLSEVLYHR